jgi:glycerophosphoryl diester phosphodiesterase
VLSINITLFLLPQLYPLRNVLYPSTFDPIIIAERGNTHLAPENSVEAVLALTRRMFAKRISLDLILTSDNVLVGSKSN